MSKKLLSLVLIALLSPLLLAAKVNAAAPSVNVYDASTGSINGLTSNFVFTSNKEIVYMVRAENKIVRFKTSDKSFTEQVLTTVDTSPQTTQETLGLLSIDGQDNIWLTTAEYIAGNTQNKISYLRKISPNGTITNYSYSIPDLEPGCPQNITGLTFTPSGSLWGYGGDVNTCDTQSSGLVVKINPQNGTITNQYNIEGFGFVMNAEAGPNESLLFSGVPYHSSNKVFGSISADGNYQTYATQQGTTVGTNLTSQSNSNLWGVSNKAGQSGFKSYFANINSSGQVTEFESSSQVSSNLILAKDNQIWFGGISSIGTLSLDGTYQTYQLPPPALYVTHLRNGPDDNLWGLAFDPSANKFKIIEIGITKATNDNPTITTIKAPKTGNLALITLFTALMLAPLVALAFVHRSHTARKTNSTK